MTDIATIELDGKKYYIPAIRLKEIEAEAAGWSQVPDEDPETPHEPPPVDPVKEVPEAEPVPDPEPDIEDRDDGPGPTEPDTL